MNNWIEISTQELPSFSEYGFHTGKLVDVRYADGTEETTIYNGYGLFSIHDREDATHWRPNLSTNL